MGRAWVWAGLAVVCAACDGRAETDVDGGARQDAGDAAADAASLEDGGAATCLEQLAERRVALDPMGPLTQIHPEVLFDGEAIWVVYSRPEPGGGNFDVWATRRACDGSVLVAPFLVSADPAGNDVDPSIAASGETLLIAWVTDDGSGGMGNLQIRSRTFARDGAPRDATDRTLRTSFEGAPVLDSHLGAALVARPGGGFVLAGTRAVPDRLRFSVYAQDLGLDGALEAEAREPAPEVLVSHTSAAIAIDAAGGRWLVFDRAPDDGATHVRLDRLDGSESAPVEEGLASSGGADALAHAGAVHVAYAGEVAGEVDVRIVDATRPLAERVARVIGERGRVEHSPRLAGGGDAVAVAYFRQVRGFSNDLFVASVTDPDLAPVLVDTPVPAYAPAITHVLGDYWFVSYAIGDSPSFRLVGRFVRLAR
ncbi:MAG: hypothetical protein KF729_21100 [Sandaracinaceae bacterium]|nr:hypothetical protein [Sandaracinaceae bacterium]